MKLLGVFLGIYLCEFLVSLLWVYIFSFYNPLFGWAIFAVPIVSLLATILVYIYLRKRKADWIFYLLLLILPAVCFIFAP
ncbi:hypothetical protein M0R79_05440 [Ignavigranum ruoffiae]|uniref:hypothetical protein n=1 Tax=Ignavigranum ruoffiae TaxID=89093 RepID=UPI00206B432D|nr:hypothetical protein [Ignavigranum ruoffiae]UPQ85120.1 hypothetical protein M0R79_05440 [Ignavigranum ruoffiae]